MRELNTQQTFQVHGGFTFLPFIAGSIINLVIYAASKKHKHEDMTIEGATISAATGALTGGAGGFCIKAAGGGITANIVWRPGFMAINSAGQAIAQDN